MAKNLAVTRKNWQILTVSRKKVNLKNISGRSNGRVLTVSRKLAKILTVSRKSITPLRPSVNVKSWAPKIKKIDIAQFVTLDLRNISNLLR